MDLSKYTGQVPDGDYTAKVTSVAAEKAKDQSDKLVFKADIPALELTNRIFSRSLKEQALPILRDDLEAAEALREGDSYSTDPSELADQIYEDLSDRLVTLRFKPGKNGYQDIRIIGLALEAA
jgi:hypothetical protein